MNPDDPKLTAYILGELPPEEAAEIRQRIEADPAFRMEMEELEGFCRELETLATGAEPLSLSGAQKSRIQDAFAAKTPAKIIHFPKTVWIPALVGLAACLLLMPLAPWWHWMRSSQHTVSTPAPLTPEVQVAIGPLGGEHLPPLAAAPDGSGFVRTSDSPKSSIPLQLKGEPAYEQIAAALEAGKLPLPTQVRPFELLQKFQFDYPQPARTSPVALLAEIGPCPWNAEHRLARVGIKVREASAGKILLRNASVEVRFDPKTVASWRLIGMEHAGTAESDPESGVDLESGDRVLAVYEVAPAENATASCMLILHYSQPGSPVWETFELATTDNSESPVSADYQFAAAVAAFGLKLRDGSVYPAWDDIQTLASAGLGDDPQGERIQFLKLIEKAKLL